MNTIEIRTTQNVVIEYELGKLGERIGAFIIDQVILWGVASIILSLLLSAGEISRELTSYLVLTPIIAFYTLFFEITMNGQTPGKRVMNLKAIKLTGREPGTSDYIIRWAFRMIDIWLSLGMVGSLLISSSDKRQRIGDVLSDMVVIRLKPSRQFSLGDIIHIGDKDNHTVHFPKVTMFNDEEMLLVKQALGRQRNFRNRAHDEAIRDLAAHIAGRLGADDPKDPSAFLKTILEDYIILTR